MDEKTRNILNKDSLADTEKFFGKRWDEFDDVENIFSIFKFMGDNIVKGDHLRSIGDTNYKMSWEEFKNLLLSKGFVNALTYELKHDKDEIDECIIYYQPIKGWVIFATSYRNKSSINGGTLYAEIQANKKESLNELSTRLTRLSTGGLIDKENLICSTSHDVREGLFSKIEDMESYGKFLPVWTDKDRFLWFVDYVDKNIEGYDFKKITQSKIEKCSQEFRNIIRR